MYIVHPGKLESLMRLTVILPLALLAGCVRGIPSSGPTETQLLDPRRVPDECASLEDPDTNGLDFIVATEGGFPDKAVLGASYWSLIDGDYLDLQPELRGEYDGFRTGNRESYHQNFLEREAHLRGVQKGLETGSSPNSIPLDHGALKRAFQAEWSSRVADHFPQPALHHYIHGYHQGLQLSRRRSRYL